MALGDSRDCPPSGTGEGMPELFICGVPRFICSAGLGEVPDLIAWGEVSGKGCPLGPGAPG